MQEGAAIVIPDFVIGEDKTRLKSEAKSATERMWACCTYSGTSLSMFLFAVLGFRADDAFSELGCELWLPWEYHRVLLHLRWIISARSCLTASFLFPCWTTQSACICLKHLLFSLWWRETIYLIADGRILSFGKVRNAMFRVGPCLFFCKRK